MNCEKCGVERETYGHGLPYKFICGPCYFKEYDQRNAFLEQLLQEIEDRPIWLQPSRGAYGKGYMMSAVEAAAIAARRRK